MEANLNESIKMLEDLINDQDRLIMEGIDYSRRHRVDIIFYRDKRPDDEIDCVSWVDFNANPCNHNFNFQNVVAIARNGVINIKEKWE